VFEKVFLSQSKQEELIKLFVAGATAKASAQLVDVHANTAIKFFMNLRKLIASKLPSYDLSREVEADESYFGGTRKGKRGRGSGGKVAVFGTCAFGNAARVFEAYKIKKEQEKELKQLGNE
jgi:transposase